MNSKLIFTKILNLFPCNNQNYDIKTAKSLCFLGYGYRIGDLLTASFIFREIKKFVPEMVITVAVESKYMEFVSSNKYIDKIKLLPENTLSLFQFLNKNKFDIIINLPWDRYSKIDMLIYKLSKTKSFVFENSKYNYNFINFPIKWEQNEHITQFLAKIPKVFGNDSVNFDYELSLPNKYNKNLSEIIDEDLTNYKILLFNPEAFEKVRTLCNEKINIITREILKEYKNIKIILLSYKQKYDFIDNKDIIVYKTNNIFDSAAIIKESDFVLSVDTAIVHIADYYKKKMVALYSDDKFSIENNFVRFCSINPDTIKIKAKKDETVNNIDVNIIISALRNMISGSVKNNQII